MGLSGFRVGFLMANDHIMDILYGSAVNFIGATNTASQLAVIEAFKDLSFMEEYRQKHMRRAKYAYETFNSVENISMPLMESGFFSWINVSKLDSSANIVNYLMDNAKVMVNDGKNYGECGDGYLRIIHGVFFDDEKSFNAIDRIANALKKFKK